MAWVAVAAAGASLAGGALSAQGGKSASKAAGRAANEARYEARRAYRETASIVNPATAEGLAALDRDIKLQEKNLGRQEQFIAQIDPTILEASQQALKLLKGEQASVTQPLQDQRARQRQQLVNRLREQLGPGAETSSAGMKALLNFDQQSSDLFSGAQQQYLGQLGGLATQFNSVRPEMFREIMGLSSLGQAKTDLNFKRAAALSNARLGLQQTAGASQTAALMNAQNQQAFGNQLLGAGIELGTSALLRKNKLNNPPGTSPVDE